MNDYYQPSPSIPGTHNTWALRNNTELSNFLYYICPICVLFSKYRCEFIIERITVFRVIVKRHTYTRIFFIYQNLFTFFYFYFKKPVKFFMFVIIVLLDLKLLLFRDIFTLPFLKKHTVLPFIKSCIFTNEIFYAFHLLHNTSNLKKFWLWSICTFKTVLSICLCLYTNFRIFCCTSFSM